MRVKVFLLAAGYATRLHPLTRSCPKPLLELAGRPLLAHILDRALALDDVREVAVVGNHRFAAPLAAFCAEASSAVPLHFLDDGSTEEANRLGAVGDLAFALHRSPPLEGEPVLAIAGDNYLGFDLREAQRAFEEGGRRTLLLVRARDGEPGESDGRASAFNDVEIDRDGRVFAFREKPEAASTPAFAIGVYFFAPNVGALVDHYLAHGGNPDAPGHFIAWLVRHAPVHAHRVDGTWYDIGSLDALGRAREELG